jgi:protein-L-isoaspartate(D-aspartate) O-methyltransferase
MNFELARHNMVEQQIRPWEVLDSRVLTAMAHIPRENFVPTHLRSLAFADIEIPLSGASQMLPPRVEGRILQALELQGNETILEIGSGSGYLTALLASLGSQVEGWELEADLVTTAIRQLQSLGIHNATIHSGDGLTATTSPCDAIILGGALPAIPQSLREKLTLGGRLFGFVGNSSLQEAQLHTRTGNDSWLVTSLFETRLPLLRQSNPHHKFPL